MPIRTYHTYQHNDNEGEVTNGTGPKHCTLTGDDVCSLMHGDQVIFYLLYIEIQ